ncbi:hypothetical protein CALCODRAFT_508329 [Calocera cornea HHB12733]|uniref:Uncharacterized protein n=1 Tax=Calocera cornea HHB12733 TaxID=1353952 RepID=A0A165GKL2_9BASI|nr:hypothetical protein CALCODRAFT_508329 [Calocera cornea HHB12733]
MPTTRYKLAAASAPDLNGVEPEPGSEPEPEPPAMTQGQAAKRLVNLLENGLRPEQLTAVLEYAVIMGAPAPGTVRDALLSAGARRGSSKEEPCLFALAGRRVYALHLLSPMQPQAGSFQTMSCY